MNSIQMKSSSRIRLRILQILLLLPLLARSASLSPITKPSTAKRLTSQQLRNHSLNVRGGARNDCTTTTAVKTNTAVANGIKNFLASGLAAACSKTILAPFDTIKTMQQQSINGGKALSILEAARLIMSRPKGFLELYVRFFVMHNLWNLVRRGVDECCFVYGTIFKLLF